MIPCLSGRHTDITGLYLFFLGGHIYPVALISSQTLMAPESACAFLGQTPL